MSWFRRRHRSRLIKGELPTEAMVAYVLVAKFAWHLPLGWLRRWWRRPSTSSVEKTIRDRSADERRAVRQERNKHLVLAIKGWLKQHSARLGQSKDRRTHPIRLETIWRGSRGFRARCADLNIHPPARIRTANYMVRHLCEP